MDEARRQVWRASRGAFLLVAFFAVVCVIGLPALSVVSWQIRHNLVVPVLLGALALLGLLYAWRFGLHPRIVADEDALVIKNPFRTHRLGWQEITLILPGGNGLIVAGPERRVDAWCVQKSERDIRHEHRTRADRIGDELWQLWEQHHPPVAVRGQFVIRRARPGAEAVLAELERTATIDALARIFPGQRFPFPIDSVTERWRDLLRDPTKQTFLARAPTPPAPGSPAGREAETSDPEKTSDTERTGDGSVIGVVAQSATAVLHLAVTPEPRPRGCEAMLLRCAEAEIFADPFLPEASLWVLADNQRALGFYRDHGWRETDNRRRSPYPPKPAELRMIKTNPRVARRTRTWAP